MTREMIPYASIAVLAFGTIYWWIRYIRSEADRDAMSMVVGELRAVNFSLTDDHERIDWLEQQQDRFPELRGVVFRWSTSRRGWRLHQTTREGNVSTVRGAIDVARQAERGLGKKRDARSSRPGGHHE